MTPKEMVELLGKQTVGYSLLWEDYDYILLNTPFKSTGDKKKDKEIIAYWWLSVYVPNGQGPDKVDQDIYRTWSNAQYTFDCVGPEGSYNPKTNQSAVQFCIEKDSDLQIGLEELNLLLPLIKSVEDDGQRYKYFSVFEHTLSAGGVYHIKYYDDLNITLNITSWGSERELRKFQDTMELLKYIQKNHYYE